MTMHLEKVYINNYGTCKKKLNKRHLRAMEVHNKWLKDRGLHPDQISAKRKADTKRSNVQFASNPKDDRSLPPTSDKVGNGFKKSENVYTGKNLIGIAVMHKSCLVPVFSKNDAIEISKMRR